MVDPEINRTLNITNQVDYCHKKALRTFFQGLDRQDRFLISESSENLRKRASLLGGDPTGFTKEYDHFEEVGVRSFLDAIRVLLNNEAVRVRPFEYEVTLGSPIDEKWLIILPAHQSWFVEKGTPWTREEYKLDPREFIREHFDEIPRSSAYRWSLNKADLLQGLVIELAINGFVSGLAGMALDSTLRANKWAKEATIALQLEVNQKLDELTRGAPIDLSSQFVKMLVAVVVVKIALHHPVTVDDAIEAAGVQILFEFLKGKSKTPKD